jgi:hypothetical protein
LIDLSKAEIIACGLDLGVDYGLTSSCYDPNPEGVPCGGCDSCLLRAKGFAGAGVEDPLLSRVEDPLLSGVENPVLAGVKDPVLAGVKDPLSTGSTMREAG